MTNNTSNYIHQLNNLLTLPLQYNVEYSNDKPFMPATNAYQTLIYTLTDALCTLRERGSPKKELLDKISIIILLTITIRIVLLTT